MTAREDIAFLVGSECRVETLRILREEPRNPSSLAEEASCARETAQRNLAGFTDRGWVEKRNRSYRLTSAGQMVLERYEQLERSVENAKNLDVFLANVGDVGDRIDTDLLAAQTVTTSTPDCPHAPIERWLTLVDETVDTYYGVTPIVSRVFNEAAEQAIGPDTHMELVIDQSVLETSQERFPEALELAFELDQFTLWMAPTDLEYGLTIVDGHVWVAAYDDFGNVVASVDGDDEQFLEWAQGCYDDLRSRSRQAEPENLSLT
jgi:predicted transcriptional regulator